MPSRREILKTTAASLASVSYGCIADEANRPLPPEDRDRPCWENPEGEEIDAEPLFNPGGEDEMILPDEEIHSAYERFEDEDNPEFDAYLYTEDGSHTALLKVDVYPTVDEAAEHYEKIRREFDVPESFGVGDEATEQDKVDSAELIYRKSNAVGHVKSYVPEQAPGDESERTFSPRTAVSAFARDLRDYWGGTNDYEDNPGFCREEVVELQQPEKTDE